MAGQTRAALVSRKKVRDRADARSPQPYSSRSLGIDGSELELRSEPWLLLSELEPQLLLLRRSSATASSGGGAPCSRRRWWLAIPPLRPASRASSLVHSCAVPF